MFGALLMVFVAALLSYGLKNNYTQQVMQQTFRKALALAQQNRQASYVFVNDRHIPNPSDTFGQGSFTPTSSSAFITRNYRMNETADNIEALPVIAIEVKGNTSCWGLRGADPNNSSLCYYLTAGFRDEPIGTTDKCEKMRKWEKYEMIYGSTNLQGIKQDGTNWDPSDDNRWDTLSFVRVIDSCEGEILSYDGCKRQCRVITDQQACINDCEVGDGSSCADKCSQTIETPWYCDKLDQIFQFAFDKTMGIQQYSAEIYKKPDILRKQETAQNITTTDTLNWNYNNVRMIIFRQYGDRNGFAVEQPITGTSTQNKKESWQTPW